MNRADALGPSPHHRLFEGSPGELADRAALLRIKAKKARAGGYNMAAAFFEEDAELIERQLAAMTKKDSADAPASRGEKLRAIVDGVEALSARFDSVVADADRSGWSKGDYAEAIRATEAEIDKVIKSGGKVNESDPLNKKLRELRAGRSRADAAGDPPKKPDPKPYEHKYDPSGVQKMIEKDKRIGKGEAKKIHALLKGWRGDAEPTRADKIAAIADGVEALSSRIDAVVADASGRTYKVIFSKAALTGPGKEKIIEVEAKSETEAIVKARPLAPNGFLLKNVE